MCGRQTGDQPEKRQRGEPREYKRRVACLDSPLQIHSDSCLVRNRLEQVRVNPQTGWKAILAGAGERGTWLRQDNNRWHERGFRVCPGQSRKEGAFQKPHRCLRRSWLVTARAQARNVVFSLRGSGFSTMWCRSVERFIKFGQILLFCSYSNPFDLKGCQKA